MLTFLYEIQEKKLYFDNLNNIILDVIDLDKNIYDKK